jgi:Predicted AAA-ATPase/PD-(D/E)XK nuclease superfamily
MRTKLTPLGTTDFKKIREENRYYVDKSLMVKHILEGYDITLLCRPRRFGKTLNMDMLRCFFSIGADNRHLFEDLNICRDADSMVHLGKYPVIFFSLKEVKPRDFTHAFAAIRDILTEAWAAHPQLATHPEFGAVYGAWIDKLKNPQTTHREIARALYKLSELLAGYYKTKVIILIDEYDTPVHAAWKYGYYTALVDFMKEMLGTAMKDNSNLKKGVLTGILRVSKESMFSDLNNFIASTVLDTDRFSDLFGFTEAEVSAMFRHYALNGREMDEVRAWYDGYRFGGHIIYNPWSILNYVYALDHALKPYWVNTSENSLLGDLFFGAGSGIQDSLDRLLNGEKIPLQLKDYLVFKQLKTDPRAVWLLLLMSGYLRSENPRTGGRYDLSIPNREIREAFLDGISGWLQNEVQADTRSRMLEALTKGNIKTFEHYLSEFVLRVFSYHDTQQRYAENFYHAFLLGLFADLEHRYNIRSNRETGLGRYDICLIPRDLSEKGIIFEIKTPEAAEETLENALKTAALQMERRKYDAELAAAGVKDILRIAVAVKGKEVKVCAVEV